MSKKEIRVGDAGTRFILTVKDEDDQVVDISSATSKTITFVKPTHGDSVVKAASFYTDGSDGKLFYDTIVSDLDVDGLWRYQVTVDLDTGEWKSDIHTFRVHPNLS
jgi:hypothetical protein